MIVAMMLLLGLGSSPATKDLPASSRAILEGADSIELISLDPKDHLGPGEAGFDGWRVVGRTSLADLGDGKAAVGEVLAGLDDSAPAAGCFEPRHGLRAKRGDEAIDLVICFSCGSMNVVSGGTTTSVPINGSSRAGLDRRLRAAGVRVVAAD